MPGLMNSKKINNIYPYRDFSRTAEARDDASLVYLTVQCPHCDYENVISRDYINEKMLCSSSLCRRIIIVANFDSINTGGDQEKKQIA